MNIFFVKDFGGEEKGEKKWKGRKCGVMLRGRSWEGRRRGKWPVSAQTAVKRRGRFNTVVKCS